MINSYYIIKFFLKISGEFVVKIVFGCIFLKVWIFYLLFLEKNNKIWI